MVAIADLFRDRLASSHKVLSEKYAKQMDVLPERQFVSVDAWRWTESAVLPDLCS